MKVILKKNQFILGSNVKHATKFLDKLVGLMFIKEMKDMDGLIIEDCKSIHNSFVRFPIDVLFLSRDNEIIKIIRSFKPWRWSFIYLKSKRVLELPENTLPEDIKIGDEVEVIGV